MSKEMNVGKDHQNKNFSLLKISLLAIVALFVLAFGVAAYKVYDYEKTIALKAINTYELTNGEEITEITIHHDCYIMPHTCHTSVYFNNVDRDRLSYGSGGYCYDSPPNDGSITYTIGMEPLLRERTVPGTRKNLEGIKVHYDFSRLMP